MRQAYDFLRELINGLRILRGSARDLVLPSVGSPEYAHLARRIGYVAQDGLSAGQRLHVDFETFTATVRAFMHRHFGASQVGSGGAGSAADLIIETDPEPALVEPVLSSTNFADHPQALLILRRLMGDRSAREPLARLAVLAFDTLALLADPDMALTNWERFAAAVPDRAHHFARMLAQPLALDILLRLFSTSQFLADTLVRDPDFLDWIADSRRLHSKRSRQEMVGDLEQLIEAEGHLDWQDVMRRFRRRELLRIATRDLCLGVSLARGDRRALYPGRRCHPGQLSARRGTNRRRATGVRRRPGQARGW